MATKIRQYSPAEFRKDAEDYLETYIDGVLGTSEENRYEFSLAESFFWEIEDLEQRDAVPDDDDLASKCGIVLRSVFGDTSTIPFYTIARCTIE